MTIKEDVLGKVGIANKAVPDEVPVEKLNEPLFYEGTVVRCFCFGCGTSEELPPEGAENLAKEAEVEIPTMWQGLYFTADECIVCSNKFRGVKLQKIPLN